MISKLNQWLNILDAHTQKGAGGGHTAPELRILLLALSELMQAKTILETGYDAGMTTEALALSGAQVMGVDNLSEYGETEAQAVERLLPYDNVQVFHEDAIQYLQSCEDNRFDLIFLDDNHCEGNVRCELEEIRRVLCPDGLLVCHDTKYHPHIWRLIREYLPDWPVIHLPSWSPVMNIDMGTAILQKPRNQHDGG